MFIRPPDIKIVIGAVDLDLPLEVREPSKLILHEDFDRITLKHDIALIMLNYPIEFSNEKIPICFPYMDDISSWQHCWVAGWGMTGAGEMLQGDVFANGGFHPLKADVLPLGGVTHNEHVCSSWKLRTHHCFARTQPSSLTFWALKVRQFPTTLGNLRWV